MRIVIVLLLISAVELGTGSHGYDIGVTHMWRIGY